MQIIREIQYKESKNFKDMKVVFMGTPEFAVETLEKIHEAGHEVVAVVTVADKPSGRGMKLTPSPVKICAQQLGIPLLQPEKLKDPVFIQQLTALNPDIAVVVAFRMLPEVVWRIPKMGTLNLHASLLPDYRGAAPINHALINGEKETGVTTFFIDKEIDTGNLLMQEKVKIGEDWNAGILHDVLKTAGAGLVVKTLSGLQNNTITPIPQDEAKAVNKAPKIFREDCLIDWNRPADSLGNFIKGLSPYPTAFTTIHGKNVKIYASETGKSIEKVSEPGKIHIPDDFSGIWVETKDKYLIIKELQYEGKKRMSVPDFLRGLHEVWEKFSWKL